MDEDSEKIDKLFSEIIDSEELKDIKETFGQNRIMTIKELLLVQQTITETLSHLNEMIYGNLVDEDHLVFVSDNIVHSLLSSIYKTCMDFNDVIIDFMPDDEDDEDMFFVLEYDEDEEEDDEELNEDDD